MEVGHWGCYDCHVHESWETFSCLIRKSKFPWSRIGLSYGQFREFFDTVLTSFKFFRGLLMSGSYQFGLSYVFLYTSLGHPWLFWNGIISTGPWLNLFLCWEQNDISHIWWTEKKSGVTYNGRQLCWIRPLILCINHHIHTQRGPGLPCSRPCEVSKAEIMFFCIPIHWDLLSFILVVIFLH